MVEARTVQPVPGTVEIDMQPTDSGVSPWILLVALPLAIAAVKVWEKWVPSKSEKMARETEHMTAVSTIYKDQMAVLSTQLQTVTTEQASDKLRLAELERNQSLIERRSDRRERIAHKALDRVEDHRDYLNLRIATRDLHDPDGELTPWVPDPPPHLLDTEWTQKYRAELHNLDDPDDDD